MGKDVSYDKAYAFAIKIVNLCRHLQDNQREFVLSKQLLRSGTSIGANLAEAHVAFSGAELASKASIAYKECRESRYWLALLCDTKYSSPDEAKPLLNDTDEISRILFATIKTLRRRCGGGENEPACRP